MLYNASLTDFGVLVMGNFQFKPLAEKDLEHFYQWFQEPVIKEWYARGQSLSMEEIRSQYLPRISGEENVPGFIVYQQYKPIGFIQYYVVVEHLPESMLAKEPLHISPALFEVCDPTALVGIDCFIAAQENRGKGIGAAILNHFIRILPPHFRVALLDPNIANHQAIRCYEKAGFTRTTYSEDKDILIMLKTLSQDKL